MPGRRGGMADFDREPGNFMQRIKELEERFENLSRWAAPVGSVLLPNPPGIKAGRLTAQSIGSGSSAIVTGLEATLREEGLELEDGTSIVKLRRDSQIEYYLFWVHAFFAANATGNRMVSYSVRNINTGVWSTLPVDSKVANTGGLATRFATPILHVMDDDDDAIRFLVYQDTGSPLDLTLFLVNGVMVKSGDVFAP